MSQISKSGALPWQLGLACLVLLFLAAMALSFLTAARRASPVVDSDYYRHGLAFGKRADGAANAGLAWNIDATLTGRELLVRVTDPAGAPVAGGSLSLQPLEEGAPPAAQPAPALSESAPGLFRLPRPGGPGADWRGNLVFRRGGDLASRRLVLLD